MRMLNYHSMAVPLNMVWDFGFPQFHWSSVSSTCICMEEVMPISWLRYDALARVRRCVGGGATTGNADRDIVEVVAEFTLVNLRCPMSGSRMKVAGRFKPCIHMGCFDLEVFVSVNKPSRKWQCPVCLKNYSLEDIIIDPYFNRIVSKLRHCGEDVTEIEMKPDGSWCAKGDRRDLGELGTWHLPDGYAYGNQNLSATQGEVVEVIVLSDSDEESEPSIKHWLLSLKIPRGQLIGNIRLNVLVQLQADLPHGDVIKVAAATPI